MKDVLVVTGPTASGKTKLSCLLAKNTGGQIIVADSMKVYRETDIATSKPPEELKKDIKYHQIDIIDGDERYNVGAFYRDCRMIIDSLHKKNILPIVCGGTSLYITKLVEGLADIPKLPREMKNELEKQSVENLYKKLKKIDPERAGQLHPGMKKRIVRALGVHMHTGRKMSRLLLSTKPPPYNFIILYLDWEREILYKRINKRVERMIKSGMKEEAENLFNKYGPESPVFEGVGYRQMIPYFNKEIDLKTAIEDIKKATRNYAKSQISWWKNKDKIILNGNKISDSLNI